MSSKNYRITIKKDEGYWRIKYSTKEKDRLW